MSDQWSLTDGSAKTDGPCINKLSSVKLTGLAAGQAFAWTYTPPTTARVKAITFGAPNSARCDILYGVTGQQVLVLSIWVNSNAPTFTWNLAGYLPLTSAQILQATLWNTHTDPQDLSVCFHIVEA